MVTITVEGESKKEVKAFIKTLKGSDHVIDFELIEVNNGRYRTQGIVGPMAIYADVDRFIYALNLFNEKVEKLLNLSFVQQYMQVGNVAGIKAERRDDGSLFVQDTSRGPSSESIDAVVLTVRFFIQNNEECSLMNLAKHYKGATVGIDSAALFLNNRKEFNAFLDELTGIAMDEYKTIIISNSEDGLTRDEVFNICVYGSLSHANRAKKEKYDSFNTTPDALP